MMATLIAMQQKIDLLLNPTLLTVKPVIYKRTYIPWSSTDKEAISFTEKRLLQANSAAIFNPNVRLDTIVGGKIHTRSVARYIKEMEKECVHIPDSRAAYALAMGTDPSVSLIIKHIVVRINHFFHAEQRTHKITGHSSASI